jgi:dephospho-CoA kinase/carbonic anhydrase/acetyltransferase-like protein (isoleucine patch superfamily)
MTRVICLTGGLASGKSTAARHLRELGAHVIDADQLGHRVYEPGSSAHARIAQTFGADVVASDGRIDRKALGAKVFGQAGEMRKLTDIVWPAIRRLAAQEIAERRRAGTGVAGASGDPGASGVSGVSGAPVIVLEAAVLFEAGWQDLGDEVWVNVVDREVAIARATARDGASRAAIEQRLDAQLSNAERIALADVVIDNNGSTDALLAQVRRHWQRVRAQPLLRQPHVGPEVELEDLALLHPTAQLHGRVWIGPGASVWPYVVMRSEMHHIRIGARTNLQDFVMVHVGNGEPTVVGEDCSITHHVTLHGCEIGDRCLIGINATIMDGAKIGANSIVAGHTIVMQHQVFPENSVIAGVPAKLIATRDNGEANVRNARFYEDIARRLVQGKERLRDDGPPGAA